MNIKLPKSILLLFFPPQHSLPSTQKHTHTTRMQEYEFVEDPSINVVCPLIKCVMLEPYKADCCGGLYSAKAATKLEKTRGACTLCRKPGFTSHPDKHARDKIQKLRVYCPHRRRGCDWEGEISSIVHHVQSECLNKNSSLETDLAQ